MKKLLVKVLPAAVLALTLCLAIAMLAACGGNTKKDVEFKGDTQIGNLPVLGTLTLKTDNTCEYTVFIDTENEQFKSFETALKNSGTWEMSGEEYKVTLGEGDKQQVITSTHEGSTYTLVYSMTTEFGPRAITLNYTALDTAE